MQDEDDKSAEGATGSKMEVRGGILDTGCIILLLQLWRFLRAWTGVKQHSKREIEMFLSGMDAERCCVRSQCSFDLGG